MSGDAQVRFCERLGVQFPRATHLVQSTGDGIFALFGAPVAHEDLLGQRQDTLWNQWFGNY
jgi:hypothetical protein